MQRTLEHVFRLNTTKETESTSNFLKQPQPTFQRPSLFQVGNNMGLDYKPL